MSDLDESRRHGVPIDTHHTHTPSQLSALNENLSALRCDRLANGWHPNGEPALHQQQHGTPSSIHHAPQQPLQTPINPEPVRIIQNNDIASAADLDGELSGLQKAATKTALLIPHRKATRSSLEGGVAVVTTEEDEDEDDRSSHWIFRRHVGFSELNETQQSRLHHQSPVPTSHEHVGNGAANKHFYQRQYTKSAPILSTTSTAADERALEDSYEIEKSNLLQQLNFLRQKRQHLQQTVSPNLKQHINEWNFQLSTTQQSHSLSLTTLESISAKRIHAEEEYQIATKWHVLGDVFFIWHRGPFGTINGFRLGKSAVTMVGLVKKGSAAGGNAGGGDSRGNGGSAAVGQQGGSGGGAGSLFSWGASSDNKNGGTASRAATQTNNAMARTTAAAVSSNNSIPEKVSIPWNEINSALGQVVFLLYTLQNAPHSGIAFRKHVLQPCGSSSKIGILKRTVAASSTSPQRHTTERRRITALAAYYNSGTPSTSNTAAASSRLTNAQSTTSTPVVSPAQPVPLPGEVTWYNLHHYEESGSMLSMGYYARRNFNTALEALLYCIAEACFVVEKRDMALAPPYVMRVDGYVVGKDVHGGTSEQNGTKSSGGGAKDGEATIGGLPLAYDPSAGEQWTMVCKYLLTNLKWLVAYAAKHVDR